MILCTFVVEYGNASRGNEVPFYQLHLQTFEGLWPRGMALRELGPRSHIVSRAILFLLIINVLFAMLA